MAWKSKNRAMYKDTKCEKIKGFGVSIPNGMVLGWEFDQGIELSGVQSQAPALDPRLVKKQQAKKRPVMHLINRC